MSTLQALSREAFTSAEPALYTLVTRCPDATGIVAGVAGLLASCVFHAMVNSVPSDGERFGVPRGAVFTIVERHSPSWRGGEPAAGD